MIDQKPRSDDLFDRLDHGIAKGEAYALVGIVSTMIILAAVQFFLRKAFDFGFEWADILVRQMVLWLGFVGGALATYQGRHIAIDAVTKLVSPKQAAALRVFTSLLAAGLVALLVKASWVFVNDEIDSETMLFGDVPQWIFQAIIPIVFVLIVIHFVLGARHHLLVALGRREPIIPDAEDLA